MIGLPAGYTACIRCKERAFRTRAGQVYCEPCSTAVHVERQREAKDARASSQPRGQDRAEVRAALREAAVERCEPTSIAWLPEAPVDLAWIIRVAVPFSYRMSKNAIWASVGAGHVVLRKEARAHRTYLTNRLKEALVGTRVATNRLWIDLLVEKPNHRGDALNVIDLVADAIKDATGLDDRWYSLRRMDWRVTKREPRIYVGIGQADTEDVGLCSYCGRLLALDAFTKNSSTPNGRSRVCRECSRLEDRTRRPKGSRSNNVDAAAAAAKGA